MASFATLLSTLGYLLTGRITKWSEFKYAISEGLDPKLPAHERWLLALKEEKTEPLNAERPEFYIPLYKVILRDKFSLRLDDVFYFSKDKKRIDACLKKISEELRTRTAGEFYDMWIVNRNLDFLIGVEEQMEFPRE